MPLHAQACHYIAQIIGLVLSIVIPTMLRIIHTYLIKELLDWVLSVVYIGTLVPTSHTYSSCKLLLTSVMWSHDLTDCI